jgi:hypothetical protein
MRTIVCLIGSCPHVWVPLKRYGSAADVRSWRSRVFSRRSAGARWTRSYRTRAAWHAWLPEVHLHVRRRYEVIAWPQDNVNVEVEGHEKP